MKQLTINLLTFILLLSVSCKPIKKPHIELQIINHVYYDNLSSASGVSVMNKQIMLVGDDIPWLVEINDDFTIGEKTTLSGIDSLVSGRTPSSLKSDFECMETFEDNGVMKTLILSSGSKLNSRDTAVLLTHNDSLIILKKNIRPLFEQIKLKAKMGDEEINIEGIAVTEQNVYLFHRGNISGNFIAVMRKSEFLENIVSEYFHHSEITIIPFLLPKLNKVQSGFSGACYYADQHILLFTASMEATASVTADGEVSGSYIGYIPLDSIEKGIYHAALFEDDGHILTKKLESISVKSASKNDLKILTVCDNDNGSSDLYEINLKIWP